MSVDSQNNLDTENFAKWYSTLARKWEFEQMGFLVKNSLLTIREEMGIRENGDFNSLPPADTKVVSTFSKSPGAFFVLRDTYVILRDD